MATDQRIVGDYVGHQAFLLHFLQELQGSLWLLALFAGADQGTVGNYIGHHALLPHGVVEL